MPAAGPLISVDSHVVEPPVAWERVDRRFRADVPTVERRGEGDWLCLGGDAVAPLTVGAQPGKRFGGIDNISVNHRWEDVVPGAYDPAAHLRDNEADGVHGSVLYPTFGFLLYRWASTELLDALATSYNEWIAEFSAHDPARLKGAAMLNVDEPAAALRQLVRAHELGLVAALLPAYPGATRSYADPAYEPLWSAAEEMGIPLGMHVGAVREPRPASVDTIKFQMACWRPQLERYVREGLTQLIFGGVFARHPRLRVGSVEHELSWIPYFLMRLDDTYFQSSFGHFVHRYPDGMSPSDVFRSNVFVAFSEDRLGVQQREIIGPANLMWSSDYPHTETTWPRSRSIVDQVLDGVSDDEREAMTWRTAADLYGFEVPAEVAR